MHSSIKKRLAALEAKRNARIEALWRRVLDREKEILPTEEHGGLLVALRDNESYPDQYWQQLCDDPIARPLIEQINRYGNWRELVKMDVMLET